MLFAGINWTALFAFSTPPLEIIIRGSVGVADILILVIVADASQNAMAGEYTSVSDGMILTGTLIDWNILLDWLAFRFKIFRRFAEPGSQQLVRNSQLLRRDVRREFIPDDERWSKLRAQGIESLAQVKAAYLEPDGTFSVIRYEEP